MKKLLIIICLINALQLFGQFDENGNWCQINVNNPDYGAIPNPIHRYEIISATVKLSFGWGCTGTLINRNTSDGEVGYYILTARHCISGNGDNTGGLINFNNDYYIMFNYQSPDDKTYHTPLSNQGKSKSQSASFSDNGYQYLHKTKLKLVADYIWGDLAILELETPVPPHFNISYAGWIPNKFYNGVSIGFDSSKPSTMVTIHHPKGDIKKINGVDKVWFMELTTGTACYTVTSVIDVLFGWIWGNDASTSVVCKYVDIPWLNVPYYKYGIIRGGSSGSGIFNFGNKEFGVLSGAGVGNVCGFQLLKEYGKLHSNYSNSNVKNTLNPNHNVWVDIVGLAGRKVTCYNNLNLPWLTTPSSSPPPTAHYFPADDYQSENKIVLNAINDIYTSAPIEVYTGADYEFKAGNSVTWGDGFHVQRGAKALAAIEGCIANAKKETHTSPKEMFAQRLKTYKLPEHKIFDMEKYVSKEEHNIPYSIRLRIFPNPASGRINILSMDKQFNQVILFNVLGDKMMELKTGKPVHEFTFNKATDVNSGTYFIEVHFINGDVKTEKVIFQ